MKAVVDLTPEEHEQFRAAYMELHNKTKDYKRSDLLDNYTRKFGYAHYTFSGRITDKFVEALGRMPTANEVIMLVDSGYSHFGASCTINGRFVSGKVYID